MIKVSIVGKNFPRINANLSAIPRIGEKICVYSKDYRKTTLKVTNVIYEISKRTHLSKSFWDDNVYSENEIAGITIEVKTISHDK